MSSQLRRVEKLEEEAQMQEERSMNNPEQLREWLGELPVGDGEHFRFSEEGESDGIEAHYRGWADFCTAANTYHLSVTDDYLGCTVSARTVRPGEDWIRGRDLPDGKFSRETFDRIMRSIIAYELVVLAEQVEPVAVPA